MKAMKALKIRMSQFISATTQCSDQMTYALNYLFNKLQVNNVINSKSQHVYIFSGFKYVEKFFPHRKTY